MRIETFVTDSCAFSKVAIKASTLFSLESGSNLPIGAIPVTFFLNKIRNGYFFLLFL